MKLKYIVFSLFTACAVSMNAQKIIPVKENINCGEILYDKPHTVKFEMQIKGKKHVSIDSIESSCGCIDVKYPKEIRGKKDFVISATYDARTLGHFNKYLLVYTSTNKDKPIMLTFRGVVKSEIEDYGRDYQFEINGIKMDKQELIFDNVNKGELLASVIHIKNSGNEIIEPNIMHLPKYLEAEVIPERIYPNKQGTIKVKLNSEFVKDFGLTQSKVYIGKNISEKVSQDKAFPISIILLPPTENLTERELLDAPHISLSTDTLDLGSFDGKKKKSGTIEIKNTGKMPLNIKSMQLLTSGINIKLDKQTIESGKTAKLKITAIQKYLEKRKPRIIMITDDPKNMKLTIYINIK